jgi:hypothetical protein
VAYHFASTTWNPEVRNKGWILLAIWYLWTKIVKRIGLFRRNPWDIVYLPVSIFFGFAHGIIKLIALFTWNVVGASVNVKKGSLANSFCRHPGVVGQTAILMIARE